jgi:hypothetical protein
MLRAALVYTNLSACKMPINGANAYVQNHQRHVV